MRLPHFVAILYYLPWFCSVKVSNINEENVCGNRMCKRAFRYDLPHHQFSCRSLSKVLVVATFPFIMSQLVVILFFHFKVSKEKFSNFSQNFNFLKLSNKKTFWGNLLKQKFISRHSIAQSQDAIKSLTFKGFSLSFVKNSFWRKNQLFY